MQNANIFLKLKQLDILQILISLIYDNITQLIYNFHLKIDQYIPFFHLFINILLSLNGFLLLNNYFYNQLFFGIGISSTILFVLCFKFENQKYLISELSTLTIQIIIGVIFLFKNQMTDDQITSQQQIIQTYCFSYLPNKLRKLTFIGKYNKIFSIVIPIIVISLNQGKQQFFISCIIIALSKIFQYFKFNDSLLEKSNLKDQNSKDQSPNEIINLKQIENLNLIFQQFPFAFAIYSIQQKEITYINQQFKQKFDKQNDSLKEINTFILGELQVKLINTETFKCEKKEIKKSFSKQISFGNLENVKQKLDNSLQKIYINQVSGSFNYSEQCLQESKFNTLEYFLSHYLNGKFNDYFDENQKSLDFYCYFQSINYILVLILGNCFLCKLYKGEMNSQIFILMLNVNEEIQFSKIGIQEKFKQKIIDSFSHELRTPLNSANIFLEAGLMDSSISEKDKEIYLRPALSSLRLQRYLINDIIDFSQFHAKTMKFQQSIFTVREIINEINDLFYQPFKLKKLTFSVNLTKLLPISISSDFSRLMQILINLIQNSIKFTQIGSVTLTIQKNSEDSIKFSVKDEGLGITKEKILILESVFKLIKNEGDYVKQKQWQGFGLIASQMIINVLGPQSQNLIKIKSKGIGYGTKVSFFLKNYSTSNIQSLVEDNLLQQKNMDKFKSNSLSDLRQLQAIVIIYSPGISYRKLEIGSLDQIFESESEEQQIESSQILEIDRKIKNLSLQNQYYFFENHQKFTLKQQSFSNEKKIWNNSILKKVSFYQINNEENKQIAQRFKEQSIQYFENCTCKKILSVDDDIFNQTSLKLIINNLNIQVQQVNLPIIQNQALNGKEAILAVKKEVSCGKLCRKFILILMDCQMPILDGWEATKQLKTLMNNKVIPLIPIYGLTAFTSEKDIQKCFQAGMTDVFSKPFQVNKLKEILIHLQINLNQS